MVTREEINSKSHTRKQLQEWGVPWPPPKGWKKKLSGFEAGSHDELEQSRLEMKKLYQEKSGDYSY